MHVALYPAADNWKQTIAKMRAAWQELYPDQAFSYTFFDESIV